MDSVIDYAFCYAFYAPAVVFGLLLVIYVVMLFRDVPWAYPSAFMVAIVGWGIAFSLLALAGVVVTMIAYETATGYAASQGPLAWMCFYGPWGLALGQIFGFWRWVWKSRNLTKAPS